MATEAARNSRAVRRAYTIAQHWRHRSHRAAEKSGAAARSDRSRGTGVAGAEPGALHHEEQLASVVGEGTEERRPRRRASTACLDSTRGRRSATPCALSRRWLPQKQTRAARASDARRAR